MAMAFRAAESQVSMTAVASLMAVVERADMDVVVLFGVPLWWTMVVSFPAAAPDSKGDEGSRTARHWASPDWRAEEGC